MRLIDADAIHWWKGEDENGNTVYILDKRDIDKEPTSYDVDKVVEQLETDSSVKLYGSGNSDNYLIPVKRAIDIVKDGGVADDVCEWKSDCHLENDNPAEWLISPHNPKRIFSTDIIYCPYYGKKIKVVE